MREHVLTAAAILKTLIIVQADGTRGQNYAVNLFNSFKLSPEFYLK
jgi:hypothetical protein